YTGSVIGDLNSRRGQIQGQDMRGNANVVNAMVPLANMFGYVSNLRSMSQGRATFTMQFDHYEQGPQAVAAEIQAKFACDLARCSLVEKDRTGAESWPNRNSNARSRIAMLGPLVTWTTARRR